MMEVTLNMTTKTTRLSLDSFKSAASAANVKDQLQMITGGAMALCHKPSAKQ